MGDAVTAPWGGIARKYGMTVSIEPWDASATDGGGNPIPAYGTPYTADYAVFDPGTSWEPVSGAGAGSSRVITTPTLFFLPGVAPAINPKDRITIPGNGVFEVDGWPRVWPVGVACVLKRVDG